MKSRPSDSTSSAARMGSLVPADDQTEKSLKITAQKCANSKKICAKSHGPASDFGLLYLKQTLNISAAL